MLMVNQWLINSSKNKFTFNNSKLLKLPFFKAASFFKFTLIFQSISIFLWELKLQMKNYLLLLVFLFSLSLVAQEKKEISENRLNKEVKQAKKAPITLYKIYTLNRDTTYVDTSLTIKSDYRYNNLRRDNFGLMSFSNEGQTYNSLQFGLNPLSPYPEFGYKAKHFGFFEAHQMKYYSVATPLTDLYFKTVFQQGQSLDAFITLNTSKRQNFSIAYKGLYSLGRYINQASSTGNFRFTWSYANPSKRYSSNLHFTVQDILNGENGGLSTPSDFESQNPSFDSRARLGVYMTDAFSMLKGNRLFWDHNYQINKTKGTNNLYLTHQFSVEHKYYEYNQATIASSIITSSATSTFNRFGDAYVSANINDQTQYNKLYNKVGAVYENSLLGRFQFYVDDFKTNYFYNSQLYLQSGIIPNAYNVRLNTFRGQYDYRKNKWRGTASYSNSITSQGLFDFDAQLKYAYNEKNSLSFEVQKLNKLPDNLYNFHQSSYINYNWYNHFNNEKYNTLKVNAQTQWGSASLQVHSISDYLYFQNVGSGNTQLVTPQQYSGSINYLSLKIDKEFKFKNLALDNTVLYQQVEQGDFILNVPKIITRNTLYYSNYYFNKALYLQTGVTINYFTSYFANDYNPILGEFFVQRDKQIGNFPMLDFFINGRIKQCRIFLKAEHFNSSFTGNNFYATPNTPYRDFTVRFGIIWNFFQ